MNSLTLTKNLENNISLFSGLFPGDETLIIKVIASNNIRMKENVSNITGHKLKGLADKGDNETGICQGGTRIEGRLYRTYHG